MNKEFRVTSWFVGRTSRLMGLAAIALGLVAAASSASAKTDADVELSEVAEAQKITVHINDTRGYFDFQTENVREDLLRNAFYDAARRNKWFGDYDFKYNDSVGKSPRGTIEFNVVDWRRSPSGMYRFSASATYWNLDGEKVSLGTFHGNRSSITVFNGWDVGRQFSGTAEDAFRDALRKLEKETIES